MGYRMLVPRGYEVYKKLYLQELERKEKARKKYEEETTWRTKYYIV